MKVCPNCGWQNGEEQTVCAGCGAPLTDINQAPVEQFVPEAEQPVPDNFPEAEQPVPGDFPEAEQPIPEEGFVPAPPKKKSKKGLWIGLGCGIVVVALAVAAFFLFRYLTNPMRKVSAAAQKTVDALTEQFTDMEGMKAIGALVKEMDATRYTETIHYTVQMPGYAEMFVSAALNYDAPGKQADGTLSLGITDVGTIRAQFAANNEELQIGASQLFGDTVLQADTQEVLEALNEAFGTELFDTSEGVDLFRQEQESDAVSILDTWNEACGQQLEAYLRSMEPEKQGTTTVGDHIWTEYLMTADPEAREAFVDSLIQYIDDSVVELFAGVVAEETGVSRFGAEEQEALRAFLEQGELTVSVDERGYLVACGYTYEGEYAGIRLEGEENPWEKIVLTDGTKDILTASVAVRDGQLIASLWIPEDEETTDSISLVYTDATGDYIITIGDGTETLSFNGVIKAESDAFYFSVGAEVEGISVLGEVEMKSLEAAPQPLSGEKVLDFMNMTDEESYALMEEMQANLFADEEIMAILNFFVSGSAGIGGM